jgi:nitrate/TMAO reductase-like tetraheme cytochrome c subunit
MKKLALYFVFGFAIVISIIIIKQGEALALDQNSCLSCHGNEGLSKPNENGGTVSLYVDAAGIDASAHRYIDCTTCHGSDPHKTTSPLDKQSSAEACGACHQYEFQQYEQSIHGQQLMAGNNDVATCVDCHSPDGNPHSVIRTLEYNAPTYKKNIADTCGNCHDDQTLMASYGILEKTYESYMRSFHGKAIELGTYKPGALDEATCTNCHGAHDIKALNDPASPVAGMENLARTCNQCHAGAGVQFAAGFLGHQEASPDNIAPVHYTEILFRIILTSVLSFGAIVVITAIIRFSINRWRK